MHPEKLLLLLDELDEFTVLVHDAASLHGLVLLIAALNGVLVGAQTGSALIGVAAAAAGFAVSTLVAAACKALRRAPAGTSLAPTT